MWESYCGKACEVCPARDAGDCPGCRSGPGSAWSGECDIARCCRNSGHESCDTCTKRTSCGLYDSRERQSEYRARRRADEAEMRGRNAEKAAYMTKWLTPLFWLNIATIAANLMTDENVLGVLPALYWPGTILSLVCYVGIIVTLFKLKAQDELYGKSAGMQIVSLVLSLLGLGYLDSLIVSHLMLSLLISLAAAVFDLLATCYEFTAHSRVLVGVSATMSESWRKLWRWFIYAYVAMFFVVFLVLAFASLAALLALASTVVILVVSVLRYVYLWRTLRCFRSLTGEGP